MEGKQINQNYYKKVEEVNSRLEGVKFNFNGISSTYKIPENIIGLEGVEYLLKLNVFNEVPTVLTYVAPYLLEYRLIADVKTYSEDKFKAYVEKGTELIERILGLYESLGIDLRTIDITDKDLFLASKWYVEALANDIGKTEEFNLN